MLLADATSTEQVEAALEAGDDELCEDIEAGLSDARREFGRNLYHYAEYDDEWIDFSEIVQSDEFVDRVVHDSPAEYPLDDIPRDVIREELSQLAAQLTQRGSAPRRSRGFELSEQGGGAFSFEIPRSMAVWFPDSLLPDGYEHVPEAVAEKFWEELASEYGIEWSETDELGHNTGTIFEGVEPLYITSSVDKFYEWCRDVLQTYIDDLIGSDPDKALELFVSELSAPAAKAVTEHLSPEEALDFAHRFFVTGDREEVEEEIEQFLVSLQAGADEPRETILDISKERVAGMGIRQGTMYEEAPWSLVKLHAVDLRAEGTRMRHCVGDRSMGYLQGVIDGDVEIWSLRSPSGKPRFTLEVDPGFWEAETPEGRADAIHQLKGKANRTPGHSSKNDPSLRFPEEVVFWEHALRDLKVDPYLVADMDALRSPQRLTGNPQRSFNRPYQRAEAA